MQYPRISRRIMAGEIVGRGIETGHRPRLARVAFRLLILLFVAGVGVALYRWAIDRDTRPPAATAQATTGVPVVAGPATTRDMPIWLSGIGSVQPLSMVTVKVRVDGQLNRVAFTEGQDVHAGDVLAQIDPRTFQAQLNQALANQAKDQAQLTNARLDLGRAGKLATLGAGTTQNVDTLKAQAAALEASVAADQAMVDSARLNLEFCTVTAPIDGRVGMRLVDPGAIVHASDQTGLVTVTQMQPIAVLFSLPQDELADVVAGQARGALMVAVSTRDGSRHLADGKLMFIDSQVDQATGQVRFKAVFANADRSLWPGEFVTARVNVRTEHGVTVVPVRAVQRGENGAYVYVVKPDRTVAVQAVKPGVTADGFTEISSGIAAGDIVVFDGQSRLAPGVTVEPRPPP
jgi:multidrug efflux system membrane fusion protein